ncbi:Cna B-type domain-containing protein [Proteiniclasticum sp. C24MP]|uniref:Cna B-type domain-containing protein n=1 Tax=Proteiniclasticum sp. C24MP TaxID=3374101 RepID=UPI00375496FD
MKIGKMMRWFLSVFLSVLLVSPSALKVNAEEGPNYSLDTESSIILNVDVADSTNSLTTVRAIWTYGDYAYLLIESTKELLTVSMDGIDAAGDNVRQYAKGQSITVGSTVFSPVKSNSFLTVARFPADSVSSGSTHDIQATLGGGGHVLGELTSFAVPKLQIDITKEWNGGPMNPVTASLYRSDLTDPIGTYVFDTVNNTATITDLGYSDGLGRIYNYTVVEDEATVEEGYTVSVNKAYSFEADLHQYDFTITNSYTRPVVDIHVEKKWNDGDDSSRPEFITLNLFYLNELEQRVDVRSVDVYPDENGSWNYTFKDQYKYDDEYGIIDYMVEEETVEGYKSSVVETSLNSFVATNTRLISIEGTKTWRDDPLTSTRPESITVVLLRNDSFYKVIRVEPDASGDWNFRFDALEEYDAAGNPYSFTIEEIEVDGYFTSINGYEIINTQSIDITGTKTWIDEPETEARPDSITVVLLQNEEEYKTLEVAPDMEGNWTYTFSDLPKFDENGASYAYTIDEADVEGYVSTADGYDLVNTRTGTVSVSGTKTWLDEPETAARPDSISVVLLQNGEEYKTLKVLPDTEGNWTYTFSTLPEFDENGVPFEYSIDELEVEGYATTVEGYDLTNTRTGTVSVSGDKTWLDEPETEARPDSIRVVLLQNEVEYKTLEVLPDTEGNWTYIFSNLPEFDENGFPFEYSIDELEVEGYETAVDGYDLINTRVGTVDISGTKTWLDEPETAMRPDTITVVLLQNGEEYDTSLVSPNTEGNWMYAFSVLPQFDKQGVPYVYTIDELEVAGYETAVDGYDLINTRVGTINVAGTKTWLDEPETEMRPDSITVVLLRNGEEYKSMTVEPDLEENWIYAFNELPEFDEEGVPYAYSIEELEVAGYTSNADGYDLINTRVGTTSVSGNKTWVDEPETEMRPASITVVLLQNEAAYKTLEVMPDTEDNWTYAFGNLPEFDDNGMPYVYSIEELEVDGYTSAVDGYDLINTRTGTRTISGTKTWMDEPETAARPDSITVVLLQNDAEYKTLEVMADAEGNWTYTFSELPEFDEYGVPYAYSIDELEVEGYTSTIDGYDLINTRVGTTNVAGTKSWLDEPETEMRPDSITVVLLQNGVEYDTVEVMADELGEWVYTFTELPEFDENGVPYDYTIEELEVEGYVSTIDGYNLINTRVGTVDVTGTKTWMDEPETEMRPDSITVILLQNDAEYKTLEVMADTEGNWTYTFNELPEFDEYGVAYAYSIDELEVEGYTSTVDGYDLINTRVGTTSVIGTKSWLDEPETEMRPDSITVVLLQNDAEYKTLEVMADELGNWIYTFSELPEFDGNGVPYAYSIEELEVEGYVSTIDGYSLINTRVGTVDVTGTKTWMDEPETEMRPESITVVLLQNGEEFKTMDVLPDTEGNWTYTFSNLPEFDENGVPYAYSIEELEVEGYISTVDGYNLTNTRVGTITISGEKTWDDLSGRPEEITVLLLQNGKEVERVLVTPDESGAWNYSFENQPEFDETGAAYTYGVEELPVEGYETTVDSYDLHNRQLRGTLTILKTDNFDEPLDGAEFEIYDEEGELVFTGISDENGMIEVMLPLGTYKVMEVNAPEGFILDETPQMALLDEDGAVIELTFVNEPEANELPDTGGTEEPEEEPEEEEPEAEKPELPKTGSMNYSFWTVQGLILVLGGLLLLKKRKTA